MTQKTGDRIEEISYLPPHAPPTNHGHTTAAWATMSGIMLGAFVSAVAVLFSLVWLFWIGLGVIALALIVGRVLHTLGYGQLRRPVGPARGEPAPRQTAAAEGRR